MQGVVAQLAVLGMAAATLFAIFRHRLFEIDVVLHRSIVFGSMSVFVLTLYGAATAAAGAATSAEGTLASWVPRLSATALAAVGLEPLRGRADRLAWRLVYGRRLGPVELMDLVGRRLSTTAAEHAPEVLARSVGEGLTAVAVSVEVARALPALWGDRALAHGTALSEDIRFEGRSIGRIEIVRAPGDRPTNHDREAMRAAADLAAPALHNAVVLADLASQAEREARHAAELEDSGRRLAAAHVAAQATFQLRLAEEVQPALNELSARIAAARTQPDPSVAFREALELTTSTVAALRRIGRHASD